MEKLATNRRPFCNVGCNMAAACSESRLLCRANARRWWRRWRKCGKGEISGVQRGASGWQCLRWSPVVGAGAAVERAKLLILSACQNFAHIRSVPAVKGLEHSLSFSWDIPYVFLCCVFARSIDVLRVTIFRGCTPFDTREISSFTKSF
jgi:hypothetical protein